MSITQFVLIRALGVCSPLRPTFSWPYSPISHAVRRAYAYGIYGFPTYWPHTPR